jgi:hypothetical protein
MGLLGYPSGEDRGENSGNNFDSSDFGFLNGVSNLGRDATHPLGGCTNLAVLSAPQQNICNNDAPLVTFNENGTPESFTDTGHIIDTFGYDFINGASDGNESINWNSIGQVANRGGNVPEPTSLVLLGSIALAAVSFLRKRSVNPA